jgi:DNA-binding NarL/FixJ family response regulator
MTTLAPQTMQRRDRSIPSRRSGKTARVQTDAFSPKIRVFVAAENRLLREALARVLHRQGNVDVTGVSGAVPLAANALQEASPQVLLLTSRGSLTEDLAAIRAARSFAPTLLILLIGTTGDTQEFLECVRAGISGYLPRDASAQQVRDAVQATYAGETVCPGPFCRALFDHIAKSASEPRNEGPWPAMRLTLREQQLIPLIAQGLSNKQIASHLSLSVATIKNHVHHLKGKLGSKERTDLVEICRARTNH